MVVIQLLYFLRLSLSKKPQTHTAYVVPDSLFGIPTAPGEPSRLKRKANNKINTGIYGVVYIWYVEEVRLLNTHYVSGIRDK
jgi:hypothetical protein